MSTAPARRRLAPTERRAQIIDAALEVFAERPEEDVGLEDLAAAAGITRNLLYRYFDSRADLQRAAVDEAIARLAAGMDTDRTRPLSEKLPRNLAMWLDAAESGNPAMRLVSRSGHSQDPVVAETIQTAREALARAIALNHLGVDDPPPRVLAALDAYLALSERLIERWLGAGDLTRAEVERLLADVLPPLVAAARGRPG